MQHTLVNPPALLKLGSMNIKSVFKNAMYATTYSCMNAITPNTSLICKMLKSCIKKKLQPPENLSKGFTAISNRHVSTVLCKYLRFMILSSVIMSNCDFFLCSGALICQGFRDVGLNIKLILAKFLYSFLLEKTRHLSACSFRRFSYHFEILINYNYFIVGSIDITLWL